MEVFSKIFIILTFGLFLRILLELFENKHKFIIGSLIFAIVCILVVLPFGIAFISLVPLTTPFLILLDFKNQLPLVQLKKLVIYFATFTLAGYLALSVPFYTIPLLVLTYILVINLMKNFTTN